MAKSRKRVNDVGGRRDQFSAMLDQLWDIAAEDAVEQIRASRPLKPEGKDDDVRGSTSTIAPKEQERCLGMASSSNHESDASTLASTRAGVESTSSPFVP